jgi:hypothetical protein
MSQGASCEHCCRSAESSENRSTGCSPARCQKRAAAADQLMVLTCPTYRAPPETDRNMLFLAEQIFNFL